MKTLHVTASREYDVVIGAGLLNECGQRIAAAVPGAEKAVVYTDTTVFPLYAKRVTESLTSPVRVLISPRSSRSGASVLAARSA